MSENLSFFTNSDWDAIEVIDPRLATLVPAEPDSLYGPIREVLQAGGKRIRPFLTLLATDVERNSGTLHDSDEAALNAACAVEFLHTFTLVHDDIMDNAATRRGRPTVYAAYGTSAAILSGDALIALANEALARITSPNLGQMMAEFGLGFRCVCEGQALDKAFENRDTIRVAEYLEMIDLKTAKIIELAAVLGSVAGGGRFIKPLRSFAHHLGLAFQINDDLLDLIGDERTFGKTSGGDILEGKRTFLFAAVMEGYTSLAGDDRNLIDRIRDRQAILEDIPRVRVLLMRLGVLEHARAAAAEETRCAEASLGAIPESPARERLREFGRSLLGRQR